MDIATWATLFAGMLAPTSVAVFATAEGTEAGGTSCIDFTTAIASACKCLFTAEPMAFKVSAVDAATIGLGLSAEGSSWQVDVDKE